MSVVCHRIGNDGCCVVCGETEEWIANHPEQGSFSQTEDVD